MNKHVPDWLGFALLSLAAFRTWRLIAKDTILDRPRKWVLRLGRDWNENQMPPPGYRKKLDTFLICHWCAGFWHAVAWWGLFLLIGDWALVLATPWAASAVLALAAKNLDD